MRLQVRFPPSAESIYIYIYTQYTIKDIIDCNSRNVIYISNDNVCKISSVGYTADNMKTRFTNHKSHIKYNKRLCEVLKHFSDNFNFTYT